MVRINIILLTGGTGGHVYPAVGLAEKILQKFPEAAITFMGGGVAASPYFHHCSLKKIDVSHGGISLRRPWQTLRSLSKVFKGTLETTARLKEIKPDLVVAFGSYHTLPSLLGVIFRKTPFLLYESNAVPGKVTRLLSPYAGKTLITFPSAKSSLKGNVQVVLPEGRERSSTSKATRDAALKRYNLEEGKITGVFVGGSQGAKTLEKTLLNCMSKLQRFNTRMQWVHVAGKYGDPLAALAAYRNAGIHSCVIEYESEMRYLWEAADFAVTRAGSGTVFELIESNTPAVLVPYPFSSDLHQQKNAEFFVDTVGGGYVCKEKEEEILPLLEKFVQDPCLLEKCCSSMLEYQQKNQYKTFSEAVMEELEI